MPPIKTLKNKRKRKKGKFKKLKTRVKDLEKKVEATVEVKMFNVADSVAVNSSGDLLNLCGIVQGTDYNQRLGNEVIVKSIDVRANHQQHANAVNTTIRYMLVQDRQTVADAAGFTTLDILSTTSVNSFLNRLTIGRFKVLFDRTFQMSDSGNNGGYLKEHVDCFIPVRWNGTAATDIQRNNIALLRISDEATNTPTSNATIRLRYTDA